MAPKWILFSDGPPEGPSSNRPFNFVVPEFAFASNTNSHPISSGLDPRTGQQLYDGNGTGDAVGVNMSVDTAQKYTVFMWHSATGFTGSLASVVNMREGSGASTTDDGGVDNVGEHRLEKSGGSVKNSGSIIWIGRPQLVPEASEFGLQGGNLTIDGGFIMAVDNTTLKTKAGLSSSVVPDPQFGLVQVSNLPAVTDISTAMPSADTDYTPSSQSFVVPSTAHNEKFLAFLTNRITNATDQTDAWYPAWTWKLDGPPAFGTDIDVFNVRTNNTSAGANRSGKGFRHFQALENFNGEYQSAITTIELPQGEYSYKATYNYAASFTPSGGIDSQRLVLWRLNHFKNWALKEVRKRQNCPTSEADTVFTVTLNNLDPGATVLIVWGSTLHTTSGTAARFRLKRNGTNLTSQFARDPSGTPQIGDADAAGDGTTDNYTMPITLFWADTPGTSTATYTITASDSSAQGTRFNTQDDGSGDYKGILFAGQLSFAQDGL